MTTPLQQPTQQQVENTKQPAFELHAGGDIAQFFARENVSLIASAYKSNVVFSFGATDSGKLGCYCATFMHPMALAYAGRKECSDVWVATRDHLIRCSDAGDPYNEGSDEAGGDGDFTHSYVARQLHMIGPQDVHGIFPVHASNPFYVSTAFSALCILDSSRPDRTPTVVWKPPFVSELKAEDRCHMNGVCWVIDGTTAKAKYATCVCESDAHDGWRDHRQEGGVVVDIEHSKVVVRGLSMPHSPQWYNDELWLLNSGTGELGTVDVEQGTFAPKIFLPGFLRGLQFIRHYAIVGSSLDRHEQRFQKLQLGATLEAKKTTPVCGFFVVDLRSMTIIAKVEFKGEITELYDIALVPGRRARVMSATDATTASWYKVIDAMPTSPSPSSVPEDAGGKNAENDENEEET